MPSNSAGSNVLRNYAEFVDKMTNQQTQAAVTEVLVIGMTRAKELAPMEYGTLANSAFHRVTQSSGMIKGVGGFSGGMSAKGFNYALYLHENTNWSPRSVNKKKGPAWNPDATPFYLKRAFTDSDQKALMKEAIMETMRI